MNERKKLAIIGTVGLPACYGGFETLAEHLVEHTSDDYDITVYCSGKKYPKVDRKDTYKGARLKFLPFNANGIQSIIYDTLSIIHSLFKSDVLLVLGVAGAWLFPFVRLFTSTKIIVSIDGIEWKRDKWNKLAKWYLWWAEGLAVKYSHIDISDNESIQDYTAQRYGSLSQIIEYGADHTLKVKPTALEKKQYPFLKKSYAFKVCRIEPENNVHVILEAFSEMPKYTLVMVGNWDINEYGKNLRKRFTDCSNIIMLDPIYNQSKLDVLRSNQRAIYFSTKKDLVQLVENTSVRTLKMVGESMKNIADNRYTWKTIADKYDYLVKKALRISGKQSVKSKVSLVANRRLLEYDVAHLNNQNLFFEN